MEFLKELFGEDGIKFDDFVAKVNEKGYKLADLSQGKYVDKQKYDDEITSHNTKYSELEKKYNELNDSIKSNDNGFQKKYDDLLNNYNTMKADKEKFENENSDYKKKEIVRNAGITNDRLVNLALFELKDSTDFEKDIQNWAKDNKTLIGGTSKMPKLNGNPIADGDEEDKFFDAFYKSAGVEKKDVNAQ